MNKETVARQQITIADVRDGEKGAKGDTGPRGANGSNGAAAEFYRLQPRTKKAIVASDNVLRVNLEYTIEHVKGAHIRVETGDALGYHLIPWTNQGVFLTMTAGRVNSGTYQMANYSKTGNRPDFINVELRNKINKTLDRRTVQITMEAASFVNVIGDVRETVSQHGRNISKIEQKADGISLKVEGMKNGVRNLLKGGRLNVTSSQYGFGAEKIEDRWVKLKPDTDYTLTVCGRISGNAKANGQHLRVYLFNHSDTDSTKEWTWASVVQIGTEEDSVESIVVHTPSAGDGRSPPTTGTWSCITLTQTRSRGRTAR
ncbi:collagen-like protein [Prevotella melaninogenica]